MELILSVRDLSLLTHTFELCQDKDDSGAILEIMRF